jgi:hypothetical protein
VFAQHREQLRLLFAGDGIIVPLVDSGQDELLLLCQLNDSLDFVGTEVGEAESVEFSRLVQLVDSGQCFFEGDLTVWSMEIEDVDL